MKVSYGQGHCALRHATIAAYPMSMNRLRKPLEREAAAERTVALLQSAARHFAGQPSVAAVWLHRPHPLLLGASPAAAAWYSERLAEYATLLLENDTFEQDA